MSGTRKSSKSVSIQEKLEIIKELEKENAPSKRKLARDYNVDESSIRYIWKNKSDLKRKSLGLPESYKCKRSRLVALKFGDIEDKLDNWVKVMRELNLPVSPSILLVKAKKVAEKLGYSPDEFKASWRWLKGFRERKGYKTALLNGEGGEVDKTDEALLAKLNVLYDTVSKYSPDNIYNMDETGLFYRMLPKYSVLMPDEDVSSVRGNRKFKDRVTLVVCANATGSHKLPITLIGKPKRPACVTGREWPVHYINQKRAWMDVTACKQWFDDVFYPEIKNRTDEPVLLILDNAPGHFNDLSKDNVTVKFLPPNCTSWKQPCDLGIIAALKKRYKFLYLEEVLSFYRMPASLQAEVRQQVALKRRGTAGVAQGSPANLFDAARIVKLAWDAVTLATIRNCFYKADLWIFISLSYFL